MSKQLLLWCMGSLFTGLVMASDVSSLFDQGNLHYANKDYDQAITAYESVLQQDFESSDLYFNLGNAYFRKGDIPAAILNYERAKRLSPHDEDIAFNLKMANLKIADKIEATPPSLGDSYNKMIGVNSSHQWSYYLLAFLWLSLFSIATFVLVNKPYLKRLTFIFGLVFFGCALAFTLFAQQRYHHEFGTPEAIIFSESVYIKSSPDDGGEDLFMLHEGLKVRIIDKVGAWLRIEVPKGLKVVPLDNSDIEGGMIVDQGWLPASTIEEI